jgi:hypothetical protein
MPSLRRSPSVARVVGVPAQKIAIVNPSFSANLGRSRAAINAPATSQGLPMKAQGPAASSISFRPSHGEAGA